MNHASANKALPDALTLSRALLGGMLVWLGLVLGSEGLPLALCALVAAWTTDVLDGAVARRDRTLRWSWVGEHNIIFDVCVALGACAFLALADYVSPLLAGAYLICAGPVAAYVRSKAFANAVQAVAYAGLVSVGLFDAPPFGALAVACMALAIAITWPRFPRKTVPEFVGGIRDLLRGRR
jgi:phosphatidylglycerophosphate synthase